VETFFPILDIFIHEIFKSKSVVACKIMVQNFAAIARRTSGIFSRNNKKTSAVKHRLNIEERKMSS